MPHAFTTSSRFSNSAAMQVLNLCGTEHHGNGADVRKARPDPRLRQHVVDLAVEALDDLGRRSLRGTSTRSMCSPPSVTVADFDNRVDYRKQASDSEVETCLSNQKHS
jgi:hypothetical protein